MYKFKITKKCRLKGQGSTSEVITAIWQSLLMQFCQRLSKVDERLDHSQRKWVYLICGSIAALMFGWFIYKGTADKLFDLNSQHISMPVPIPTEPYTPLQNNTSDKTDLTKPKDYEPENK